ncbi:hypothetical protein ABPG72_014444 [Tetrahymena utriculariae]
MFQRNFQQIPQQQMMAPSQAYAQMPPQPPNQQQYMMIKQQQNGGMPYDIKNGQQVRIPYQQQLPPQQQIQQMGSPQLQNQQSFQQNGSYVQKQIPQQQPQFIQLAQSNTIPQVVYHQQNVQNGYNINQNGSSVYSQTTSTQNTLGNSRVISPERRIEEIDASLQYKNEKLNKQYSHLESLLEAFYSFEKTKNINDLKLFNQKNQQTFSDLIDEIYEYKAKIEEEKRKGDELRQQNSDLKINTSQYSDSVAPINGPLLSLQNQELQKKLDSMKEEQNRLKIHMNDLEAKKHQMDYYAETKEQLEQQIQNLEETEKQLQQEVESIQQSNQKLTENLSKKDFFKEYDFMCREKKGLNDQNEKVKQEIKLKDEELYKLKGKQEAPFPQCGMGLPPNRQ